MRPPPRGHAVVAPQGAEAIEEGLEAIDVGQGARLGHVASVEEGVDPHLRDAIFVGARDQRLEVILVAVHVAVREQAEEVQRLAALAHRAHCLQRQAAPRKIAPLAIAPFTSLAPWSKTRPAPSALWPTSLLPMSSSLGRPTAVP
jgi:hypothetical protein